MIRRSIFTVLALGATTLCLSCSTTKVVVDAPPQVQGEAGGSLVSVLRADGRPDTEKNRDAYRHPEQTLRFFGVEPQHKVVELWSGGGWYTHILAPYLKDSGKLWVTAYSSDEEKDYRRAQREKMEAYIAEQGLSASTTLVTIPIDPSTLALGVEGEADVVLTFRNIHNWVKGDYDRKVYDEAFKALRSGGVFGVVEHRGPEGMNREASGTSGYMDQAQVTADIEAAGFKFVESSEINANPKDTKDYSEGVWALPPSLRSKDVDQAKYLAIGESDRMTLKFVKP